MKLFGLIGYPLHHSFSKQLFEEKFTAENLKDHFFKLFSLKHIDDFPTLLADNSLSGLAVTIPHKQAVIPFLTTLDDAAKNIGAVNCIQFSGKNLKGYNTDAAGFEKSFMPLLQPYHTKALVLGSGGSSKAIQFVLKKNNIDFLIVSRSKSAEENMIRYSDIDKKMMHDFTMIINCTPAGMTPDENSMPDLPYKYLSDKHFLYDLVYAPEKTKFLSEGEKCNCVIKNGFEMLSLQAEENWKIWNK